MTDVLETDVVIGGGGIAGTAAAAALHRLGYRIVVIEPGQHDNRRLAGEVFHPPGVAGLAELGLLTALHSGSAATINGFCVFSGNECIALPYDTVPAHSKPGLCIEHGLIRHRMMAAASALPNVLVKQNSRVAAIEQNGTAGVVVTVVNGSATTHYRCQMLIAADGAPSRLARLAGIDVQDRRISTAIGYGISMQNLSRPEYGHVYLGAATPILVYPIGNGQARVLFDVPYQAGRPVTAADCLLLAAAMPPNLRDEVAKVIATQRGISVATKAITPESVVRGRVALVGDAGGSCHPLTATGMTMCISDALLLRDTLIAQHGDFTAALRLYEQRRRWPQATRLLLAEALRDAFIGASAEMRVVRSGILSHWQSSASGRVATLALLSTADGRPLALLRQIVAVMMRGLIVHLRSSRSNEKVATAGIANALARNLFRHIRQILGGRHPPENQRGKLAH